MMKSGSGTPKISAILAAAVAAVLAGNVQAQEEAAAEGGLEEVLVTARKRAESVQDVPVNVTAITAEKIREQDLTSLEKLAAATPDFQVGRASNGSGAQLTLRGIGSSSTSIGIEQSVAVIVDGVYYGQGRIIQEGFFDLDRLEVLKGPQALFFGKNATAGVISITTADPGSESELQFGANYEFESEQIEGEAIGSFPLTDTLGLRVAVRASDMSGGWYENIADPVTYATADLSALPNPPPVTLHTAEPSDRDAPGQEEVLGRVTLKWTPNDVTTATLKVAGDYNYFNNSSWNYVVFNCASGSSTLNPAYPCREDFVTHQNRIPADIAAAGFPFAQDDGSLYNRYRSWSVSGILNFELDAMTITSVTNWQENSNQWTCACDFQSSNNGTWATEDSTWRAVSQELRLLTSFDSPFNFMLGGLYQDTRRDFDQWIMFAGVEDSTAAPENRYLATTKTSFTDGETLSLFGQVIWAMTDTLEATAGVRYTDETKESEFKQPYNNIGVLAIFRPADDPDGLGVVVGDQSFDNWSPEATLTWKPQDDLMFYGAYKTAYKSGGFSNSGINSKFSADPSADLTFDPEEAEGFEVGMKSTLLDNQLRFNVGVYTYDYDDLQIDFFNSPIFAFQTITADAKTEGAEIQLEYAPAGVEGLSLRAVLNYNKAEYERAILPCYSGQTPAQGCTILVPGQLPFQDLEGHVLGMAPETSGSVGATWRRDIGAELYFSVGFDARYSDDYYASSFGNPESIMDSYVSWDAGIRVGRSDERWEVALVGKNLSNEFYVTGVVDGPSTGSGTGTAGGITADQAGFGTLPRTVQLRLSTRF
jgi:iron complex outermembrane receptor protein